MHINKLLNAVFIFICLSTVLNGLSFWMHRTGLLENNKLEMFLEKKEILQTEVSKKLLLSEKLNEEQVATYRSKLIGNKTNLLEFLYSVPNKLVFTKVVKFIAVIIILIFLVVNHPKITNTIKSIPKISLIFSIYILCSLVLSCYKGRFDAIIAAGYSYSFIAISLLGVGLIYKIDAKLLARYLFITILVLFIFCLYEIAYGVQIFQNQSLIGKRATGFLNQPNSMGIFVVCVCSYIVSVYKDEFNLWGSLFFLSVSALLIFFSDSTTAIVTYPIVIYQLFNERVNKLSFSIISVCFIAIFLFDQTQAFDSLLGRGYKYHYYYLMNHSASDYLFGHGLGIGTNTLLQLNSFFSINHDLKLFPADSTPLLLIMDIGIFGCILFYLFLANVLTYDSQLRFTYLAILLCSFTINIIELFPINILLGLMIASSLSSQKRKTAS